MSIMEISIFPSPLDILRQRAGHLSKLIADNNTRISQLAVIIPLLENDQAFLEVKVLNANTFESYDFPLLWSARIRNEVLAELKSEHGRLGRERVKLLETSEAMAKQLSAMGINEPSTGVGDL
jgi:hypothetical protein